MINKLLALYKELQSYKAISFNDIVEQRLDLLLYLYEDDLQKSFEKLQTYDYLEIIKEVSKNAKSN